MSQTPTFKFQSGLSMSQTQAKEVFQVIQRSGVRHSMGFQVSYDEAVLRASAQHIRDSSTLDNLSLMYRDNDRDTKLSLEAITILFDAIGASSSLDNIGIHGSFAVARANLERATEILVTLLAKSNCLKHLVLLNVETDDSFSMNHICLFLSRTDASRNFDLNWSSDAQALEI